MGWSLSRQMLDVEPEPVRSLAWCRVAEVVLGAEFTLTVKRLSVEGSSWAVGPTVRPGTSGGSGTGVQHLHLVPVVPRRTRLEVTSIASPTNAPHPRPAPGLRTVLRRPGSMPSGHWPIQQPLRHDGIA